MPHFIRNLRMLFISVHADEVFLLKEKMMKSMEQSKQQQTTHAPTSIKKTHTGPRRVPPLDDDDIEYILNSQMNKRAPPSSAARAAAIRDSFSTERTSASWKERRRHPHLYLALLIIPITILPIR